MLSSAEAELITVITAAKITRLLRSMIWELGIHKESSTPIDEDNYPNIDILNSSIPIEITRHIDVWFFYIQFKKDAGDIITHNIPGSINPVDDLKKHWFGYKIIEMLNI